jgi:ATP-dependent helicase HepA
MSKFQQGQVVCLKSDKSVTGAIIGIVEGYPETRYHVFTAFGVQTYYESQILNNVEENKLVKVDAERFNAGLTASLIRNPSITSLYSLNTARIDFIPHQFRPVLKFIRSDCPRLLIADGVGVGKTIEAGLILKELEARRHIDSVLIICPRPLVSEHKWESEMHRFGEDFVPLDGDGFRHCIHELDLDGEWPDKFKKVIIPYSLFDESNVNGTNNHRGLLNVDPPEFDLVIVDEAHHIRNTATYAYRAVSRFCESAEAVIMLTATPVQLHYDDLFVLLNLLRPDLIIDRTTFRDMAEPNGYINMASTIVRNCKKDWQQNAIEQLEMACNTDWGKKVFLTNPCMKEAFSVLKKREINTEERVQLISDIENMHTFSNIISRTRRRDIGEFTIRKTVTVKVNFTPAQKEIHDRILQVTHEVFSRIHCTDNTKFMMTTIRRQTASCLFGLVPMLRSILYRHLNEISDNDDEIDLKSLLTDSSLDTIQDQIEEILRLAEELPKDDPKLEATLEIVKKKLTEKKNKIMIFSSFRHTLAYLYKKLTERGYRVGLIHGDIPDQERRDLRRRFNPLQTQNEDPHALDIMLFSEVGCEGLDYQFCDCMINYDLPWNPMKVEQRIGRIDRNGQTSDSVTIYNMVTPGTVDGDIYDRCLTRIGVFHRSIGDCEEILGEVTSEIKKLVENFSLSDEDRRNKLQQMTDNKIRLIKEQEDLEEKQRDLFGLHLPESAFDKELRNATNYWLSPEKIQNLILCYLKQRLGTNKEYIIGSSELKKLRLSQEARMILLNDFKQAKLSRNEINKDWRKWLESETQLLDVTFESECWKNHPDATLLSITHPLVKMASEYLQSKGNILTTLKVKSDKFAAGEYPFAVYQWKLCGEREDLQIKPISANTKLNHILLDLLKESYGISFEVKIDESTWQTVEEAHHILWSDALKKHKEKTSELIKYQEASLHTSHTAIIRSLDKTLKENSDKKNYVQLTNGKIRAAQEDYEMRIHRLEEAKNSADILFELLAYGLLIITPASSIVPNRSIIDGMQKNAN